MRRGSARRPGYRVGSGARRTPVRIRVRADEQRESVPVGLRSAARSRSSPALVLDLTLVALVLALTVPIVQPLGAQQASRMALTAAVWDEQRLHVDGFPLGIDRAEHEGHAYSDKAPGQPLLAIPAYGAYRILGGESYAQRRVDGNLGLWSVSVWSAALPAALLAVALRRHLARSDPRRATPVVVATVLGTLLLPFGSVLFGHVLSTLFAFVGFALVARPPLSVRRAAAAGFLLGAAVTVEYTMAVAVAVVALLVLIVDRARFAPLLLGALPPALLIAWYQWAAFGSPLRASYARSTFDETAEELGIPDVSLPLPQSAVRVLFGDRGLFVVTPVLAAAAGGLVVLIVASSGRQRWVHAASAAIVVALVSVQIAWPNPTGGDSPGARYATAAAAFLAPGLLAAWTRWRRPTVVLAAVSTMIMAAATWTNPLIGRDAPNVIRIWARRVGDGDFAPTVYAMAFGRAAWVVVLVTVGASVSALVVTARGASRVCQEGRSPS
jgi:hypothetical protein